MMTHMASLDVDIGILVHLSVLATTEDGTLDIGTGVDVDDGLFCLGEGEVGAVGGGLASARAIDGTTIFVGFAVGIAYSAVDVDIAGTCLTAGRHRRRTDGGDGATTIYIAIDGAAIDVDVGVVGHRTGGEIIVFIIIFINTATGAIDISAKSPDTAFGVARSEGLAYLAVVDDDTGIGTRVAVLTAAED